MRVYNACSSDLTPLAQRGVLWLNTCLTVRAHNAASHAKKGWETLTAQAIRAVMDRGGGRGVVFLAWGLPAQKTCDKIKIDEVSGYRIFACWCADGVVVKASRLKVTTSFSSFGTQRVSR